MNTSDKLLYVFYTVFLVVIIYAMCTSEPNNETYVYTIEVTYTTGEKDLIIETNKGSSSFGLHDSCIMKRAEWTVVCGVRSYRIVDLKVRKNHEED